MHKRITSVSNSKIKQVVQLREKKARMQMGLTIIDGVREILYAYQAGIMIEEIFVCPELIEKDEGKTFLEKLKTLSVPIVETTQKVFEKIAYGSRYDGMLCVCRQPKRELADLKLKKNPFIVILDNMEKPGNIGAILRTCDAAGVDALIVSESTTDIYNPNVIRASIGTVFSVPVVQSDNKTINEFLKKQRIAVCVALPEHATPYTAVKLTKPLACVFGSEQKGVSDFWRQHANMTAMIPMHGIADSLNVSVAAAIVIFEVLRQRASSS